MSLSVYSSENFEARNRAFLFGDAVRVTFYIRNSKLIMAEECYFYLMASMRKMRMNIPLSYTLEYFQNLFQTVLNEGVENAFVQMMVFRTSDNEVLSKAGVDYYFEVVQTEDVLAMQNSIEMDIIKEIHVNTNLLSSIRVHCPENIYAEIYAKENELDDLILLNPSKRIARSVYGNILVIKENSIRIPKQSEGAYISPLMENFVTFVHKQNLADIDTAEMIAFETQKADEVFVISDEKGIFPVSKIRNKSFVQTKIEELVTKWKASFDTITE